MNNHFCPRIWIGLGMAAVLWGQAAGNKGGSTGGATPITTPPPTTRLPTTTQPQNQTQTQTMPDIQRPVYISGKVTLDDGTPPPEPLNMELSCGGNRRTIGYTDSKGRFNIDLSNRSSNGVFADASQSTIDPFGGGGASGLGNGSSNANRSLGGMSGNSSLERSLIGCDLLASLPGFRSDQVNLGNRRSLDNPELGVIVLHRLGNVEGLTISLTSAMAPKDARKALDKGRSEVKKGKWDNAEKEFQKAVESYPKYAAAWFDLGMVQEQQKNLAAARKSYEQAMVADPKFINPYQQLSMMSLKENNWAETARLTDVVVRLNPVDFPQAWFYNAFSKYRLENMEDAEKSLRKGLTADPGHKIPKMDYLLGLILAQKQDYTGAAEHLQSYLKLVPNASDKDMVTKQLAEVTRMLAPQANAKTPE